MVRLYQQCTNSVALEREFCLFFTVQIRYLCIDPAYGLQWRVLLGKVHSPERLVNRL